MDDVDFAELLEQARSGDAAALERLVRAFEPEVRAMVRGRLPRALRSMFDSMDFTQAALTSFCNVLRADGSRFDNARHLEAFLSGIVKNHIYEEHRRRTRTRKYDLSREEQLYVRKGDRVVPREVASRDPTPSQELQARDRFEQLTAGSPEVAEIAALRLEGLTFVEIAARVGLNERTVRRVVDGMRERMVEEGRPWR